MGLRLNEPKMRTRRRVAATKVERISIRSKRNEFRFTRCAQACSGRKMQKNLGAVVRWLGSLWLTIVLAIVLAAMLAGGSFLEATKGREWAQWYVYGSGWYIGLLGLLAANIAVATLIRCPWRWRHPGLVIGPVGLLVLLGGLLQTALQSIDGQLSSPEGPVRFVGALDPSQSAHAADAKREGSAIHRTRIFARTGRLAQR